MRIGAFLDFEFVLINEKKNKNKPRTFIRTSKKRKVFIKKHPGNKLILQSLV